MRNLLHSRCQHSSLAVNHFGVSKSLQICTQSRMTPYQTKQTNPTKAVAISEVKETQKKETKKQGHTRSVRQELRVLRMGDVCCQNDAIQCISGL
eukprot:g52422.t1